VDNEFISNVISDLKSKDLLPVNINVTKKFDLFFYNLYNKINSNLISDGIYTGIDNNESIALGKSLSEYIERKVLSTLNKSNEDKTSSLGFAAYPTSNGQNFAESKARENSYSEALERYTWASWWDNLSLAKVEELSITNEKNKSLLAIIDQFTSIKHIYKIVPSVINEDLRNTIIIFCNTKNNGFISGGATGKREDSEETIFRALSELCRHSIAYSRYKSNNIIPETFYEKRLIYFAEGNGNESVLQRIEKSHGPEINLPELVIDEKIENTISKYFVVHRCIFKNQPPFIGGELERLCL